MKTCFQLDILDGLVFKLKSIPPPHLPAFSKKQNQVFTAVVVVRESLFSHSEQKQI